MRGARPYGRVSLFVDPSGLSQGLHRNTKEKTRPLFLFRATGQGAKEKENE